jgi:hypothetical protein
LCHWHEMIDTCSVLTVTRYIQYRARWLTSLPWVNWIVANVARLTPHRERETYRRKFVLPFPPLPPKQRLASRSASIAQRTSRRSRDRWNLRLRLLTELLGIWRVAIVDPLFWYTVSHHMLPRDAYVKRELLSEDGRGERLGSYSDRPYLTQSGLSIFRGFTSSGQTCSVEGRRIAPNRDSFVSRYPPKLARGVIAATRLFFDDIWLCGKPAGLLPPADTQTVRCEPCAPSGRTPRSKRHYRAHTRCLQP